MEVNIETICKEFELLENVELRTKTDNYLELVFSRKDGEAYYNILNKFLGEPKKPKDKEPQEDDHKITRYYGGIRKEQVLYYRDFSHATITAILWPWQDGVHTTLKLVFLKK